jgi:hypothetical protein
LHEVRLALESLSVIFMLLLINKGIGIKPQTVMFERHKSDTCSLVLVHKVLKDEQSLVMKYDVLKRLMLFLSVKTFL